MTRVGASTLETRAIPVEEIVSLAPFVVRRRIAFRDCDPAGIVYTPRFLDPIATGAAELFMAELIGVYGERDAAVAHIDTPAKAVSLVFHRPSKLGELLKLQVFCSRIGTTTFEVTVRGCGADESPRFDCLLTTICVLRESFEAVPVPEYLRERLVAYAEPL